MSENPNGQGPQNKGKLLWIVGGLAGIFMLSSLAGAPAEAQNSISYTDFVDLTNRGHISEILIENNVAFGKLKDGTVISVKVPPNESLSERVWNSGVKIAAQDPPPPNPFLSILSGILPLALFFGVYYWFIMRPMMSKGGGGIGGIAKSKAKALTAHAGRVTFDDVAGIEEAKEDLKEIVDFLRTPERFSRLGAKIPRGCLLVGPPGTGKTLTARAVAGEAGVPFYSVSGSEFVEMYVGVGAARVRDMFEEARKNAPCIIFMDEIDALGRSRNSGGPGSGGNDEREQTLNQLLVEMDGFSGNSGVIIMGATNRPEILDKALLRPGRFDRQVVVGLPDLKGREAILHVHAKKTPLEYDVNLHDLARGTPGFSGADLANLVNEAALFAARHNKKRISMSDFESAKDKIMMGAERKSLTISEEERKLTAYHEAGHAIVGLYSKESDPVYKATIMPRGRALGMVMRLPEGDRVSMSLAKLKADMAVGMGGRAAEEKTFGPDKVTTGASSDIQYVTSIARKMVTEWGLSEKVGPIRYATDDTQDFLGGGSGRVAAGSKSGLVDSEVEELVKEAHATAHKILKEREAEYIRLAEALLKYETLTAEEINALVFDNRDLIAEREEAQKAIRRQNEIRENQRSLEAPRKEAVNDNNQNGPESDLKDEAEKPAPKSALSIGTVGGASRVPSVPRKNDPKP